MKNKIETNLKTKNIFDKFFPNEHRNFRSLLYSFSGFLFYFCLICFLALAFFTDSSTLFSNYKQLKGPSTLFMWIIFTICIINILFLCDYTILQRIVRILLLCILFISAKNCGYITTLISFAIAFSGRNTDYDKTTSVLFYFYFLFLLVNLFLYGINVTTSHKYSRPVGDSLSVRLDVGMAHPNVLGVFIFTICCIWIIYKRNQLKIWEYLCIAVIIPFIWYGPNSRTNFLLAIFVLVLCIISRFLGEKIMDSYFVRILFLLFYPLLFLFCLISGKCYSPQSNFWLSIDKLVSGRFYFSNMFFKEYPFSLFGQKIKLISASTAIKTGQPSRILDCGFLQLFIRQGFLVTIIYLAICECIIWWALKQKKYELVIVLLAYGILCVFEIYPVNITFNFTLLFFAYFGKHTPKSSTKRPRLESEGT